MATSIERSHFGNTSSGGRLVTQDYLDFQKRHTTKEYPAIWDMRTKYEYFHDGALSSDLVCYEPPPEGTELLVHRRYHYFKLLYNQLVENYQRCKKDMLDQVAHAIAGRGNVPTASDDAERYMIDLQRPIKAAKKQLDALDDEVSKLPGQTLQRERDELELQRRQKLEEQRARILNNGLSIESTLNIE